MHPIARLRELARRLEGGDELERWGSESFDDYLDGRGEISLDQAFGVTMHGGQAWWHQDSLERQNNALREFVATHLPGLSQTEQARQLNELILRYLSSIWRYDRDRGAVPTSHIGTIREHLFHLVQIAEHRLPLSQKQLLRILRVGTFKRPLDVPDSDP